MNNDHLLPDTSAPIQPGDIRRLRIEARLSQAAFARYVNLSPCYISQLERGARQAVGPTRALFNVIRRQGVEVLL